jgi:hypothetical protein
VGDEGIRAVAANLKLLRRVSAKTNT